MKITGKVIDRKTGEPLPFANVYISDVGGKPLAPTKGTATAMDGKYSFEYVRPAPPPNVRMAPPFITASFVGYGKQIKRLLFDQKNDFELVGGVNLPEITIIGERKKQYAGIGKILTVTLISAGVWGLLKFTKIIN